MCCHPARERAKRGEQGEKEEVIERRESVETERVVREGREGVRNRESDGGCESGLTNLRLSNTAEDMRGEGIKNRRRKSREMKWKSSCFVNRQNYLTG